MTDTLDQAKASRCYAADTCVMDSLCPFSGSCRVAMRDGARSILRDYDNPPEGGTLVPRGWVEEHMAELRAAAG